jgi:DNA-binding beta-propeller fold protein YncE
VNNCSQQSHEILKIRSQKARSAIVHTIDTAEDPLYCVVNPKGGDVYIENFNIATISVIKGNKVIKTFLPGEVPSVPAVTPNGKYLYIPNFNISGTTAGNTVSVFSTKPYTQVGSSCSPSGLG